MRRVRSGVGADRLLPGKEGLPLLCAILLWVSCPATATAQPEVARQPLTRHVWSANAGFGVAVDQLTPGPDCHSRRNLAQAAADLTAGQEWERKRQDACVDLYYRATTQAWRCIECEVGTAVVASSGQSAWEIYQRSLSHLIVAAGRFGRLDPRTHLIVQDSPRAPDGSHTLSWFRLATA